MQPRMQHSLVPLIGQYSLQITPRKSTVLLHVNQRRKIGQLSNNMAHFVPCNESKCQAKMLFV
jgi:hypothetical protein